ATGVSNAIEAVMGEEVNMDESGELTSEELCAGDRAMKLLGAAMSAGSAGGAKCCAQAAKGIKRSLKELGDAAKGAGGYSDDLLRAAQKQFPNKAGKIEQHHITPKYLGGDPKGPTVPLDAAYHQQITNAFRDAW